LVARLHAAGKATSMAGALEIDAVIDPADTRRWIVGGLDAMGRCEALGSKGG
jgi:acetyl-CoA carboxylase carboxyltransferase component